MRHQATAALPTDPTLREAGATDRTLHALPFQLETREPTERPAVSRRFLTTVLMTDIVDSTLTAAAMGDRRWSALLREHYGDCRREVSAREGELVDTTGDGVLAIFDAPTHAVRAALAIGTAARGRGVAVRAGVHTGECERLGSDIVGLAVHVTARVCRVARADEVLATHTVRDLVLGSMLAFTPRGASTLRGVPGEWVLFTARDPGCSALDGPDRA
jgi:class 3 adenylate cyclase